MDNSLAVYAQYDQMEKAATALQKSGYFKDVTSQAQAIVKVMAGAELGLPPFASMSGINIVQGRPTLGANLIATLVKNDPRYNYKIKVATDKECIIQWFENGELQGESNFTLQEAEAGNINKNWDKEKNAWKDKPTWKAYPSDMLFARAISRGARRFAPGIFGGSPVYTPDEMGVEMNEEGMIDATVVGNGAHDDTAGIQAVIDAGTTIGNGITIHPYTTPNTDTIDLLNAKAIIGSDGKAYGDCTDDELRGKLIGINKGLKKSDLDNATQSAYLNKADAIKLILESRA